MAGPEKSIEAAFVSWCKEKHGLVARKLLEGKRNGWPDRTIVLPGARIVCIEFKSEKGSLSPAQKQCIPVLERDGVPVLVTSSLKEAKQWLEERLE